MSVTPGDAERGDEQGVGVLDHGPLEVLGDDLARAADHEGAADEVDGQVLGAAGQALDVGGHPFQTGPQHVQVGAAVLPLEPLGLFDPDPQRPGQDQVQVVAPAGQVTDVDQQPAPDDPDAG